MANWNRVRPLAAGPYRNGVPRETGTSPSRKTCLSLYVSDAALRVQSCVLIPSEYIVMIVNDCNRFSVHVEVLSSYGI